MISKLRKPKDVPPPHFGPELLRAPSSPPIYASVPPPTSYKHPTSSISQSSEVPYVPPSTKEEKELILIDPKPSQILIQAKRN